MSNFYNKTYRYMALNIYVDAHNGATYLKFYI